MFKLLIIKALNLSKGSLILINKVIIFKFISRRSSALRRRKD